MTASRRKTITYYRAEFFIEQPSSINLGLCIKQAIDKVVDIESRSIWRDPRVMRLAHIRRDERGGLLLHVTMETPGEHASVVPKADTKASEVLVGTIPPPNDAEFMDGDAFLYVLGNDACVATTSLRVGTVRFFLQSLFQSARIRRDATDFDFMPALNVEKIALLQRTGVKEIELKGSMYKLSSDYAKRTQKSGGVLDKVAKHFRAIFGSDRQFVDDALRVSVTLTVDRRHHSGISIGMKRLDQIAIDIVENEQKGDEYIIITNDDEVVKPDSISLKTVVDIHKLGKSVERDEIFEQLIVYYDSLTKSGRISK